MTRRRRTSPLDFAVSCSLAASHTATTLFWRLPMLTMCPTDRQHRAELGRMVHEKAAAFVEGTFAAQREAIQLAASAMTGTIGLDDMIETPSRVAAAGLRPAFRTVKANSRRLSRRTSA